MNDSVPPEDLKRELSSPAIIIIDERNPRNILSDSLRLIDLSPSVLVGFSSLSNEGFAENPQRQRELAEFIADLTKIEEKGPLLDVGFGSNLTVATTLKHRGVPAYAIDVFAVRIREENPWHAPEVEKVQDGVTILCGDAGKLADNDSALKHTKFGLILFNGSWASGGNNFTVAEGEGLDFRYHGLYGIGYNERKEGVPPFNEFVDKEKDAILRACRSALVEGGMIGMISSRYAYHGAGYPFEKLPDEKVAFLDVIMRLSRLGAKKIMLVGLSPEGLRRVVAESLRSRKEYDVKFPDWVQTEIKQEEIEEIVRQLTDFDALPAEDPMTRYLNESEWRNTQRAKILEFASKVERVRNIARIDGLFAEF